MKKNLLTTIEELSVEDLNVFKSTMNNILETLYERDSFYMFREPESDGLLHDEWEDKYNSWGEIVTAAEELINAKPGTDVEDQIEEFKNMVDDFQIEYGGLSRLKLMVVRE